MNYAIFGIVIRPFSFFIRKLASKYQLAIILFATIFTCFIVNYHSKSSFTTILEAENTTEFKSENESLSNTYIVQNGDTLSAILANQGIDTNISQKIISLANAEKLSSSLKIGQAIDFEYDAEIIENENTDLSTENLTLSRISIPINNVKTLEFVKTDNGFETNYIETNLNKMITKYEAVIDNNFVSSLKKAGLSTNSIITLTNTFSHQIDFQRQLKSGDKIEVITEKFVTDESKFSHHGNIVYAALVSGGNKYEIFRYSPDTKESAAQFFSSKGQSIKSTLLRTPVNVVRISGHFGHRKKHPVLGYAAEHKGVDFSAPTGTPIYASGNGTVTYVGWKSGYGKFIKIRHNGELSTAYAHASKFAKGLKKGSKVKQGDVIAYVGATGRTTASHLHYEVIINGTQVNPMKFKSTPGVKLTGNKLQSFNKFKEQIMLLNKKLDSDIELAAVDIKEYRLF